MQIFPAIDIRDGRVVRLIQGDYAQQINYADDPVEVAKRFVDAGAEWLHVVDLDGAKLGVSHNLKTVCRLLSSTTLKVEIGGGIRTHETMRTLLDAGAARVILGTRSLEDFEWFRQTVHHADFSGRVVLGLDARQGMLATHGWLEQTNVSAIEIAKKVDAWPIAAIVYTDIAKDGMMQGPNFEQVEAMARATRIGVIASGGVTTIEDVRRLNTLPLAGTIIGRALYEGAIDLAEAVAVTQAS
jgi:phosphoribosylformimino-5-aminoimidazole carboxamide ribotide isomerase